MAGTPSAADGRIAGIDVARGVAIVAMVLFHLTLDLGPAFYGIIDLDATREPWLIVWARLTAGSFLFLSGFSLVLAHRRGMNWPGFIRRFVIIVAAALGVTIATRIFVPTEYVRFGILHAIAAASLIGLVFLRAPLWLVPLAAAAAFAAPAFLDTPAFNHAAWLWLGLSTNVPPMFDYVPVLPWIAPALLGIAAARWALARGWDRQAARWRPHGNLPRALAAAGRWSLVIYLVHQLLLLSPYFALVALGRL